MLSEKCITVYRKQYPDDGWCGYGMPDGNVLITDENENSVIEPYDGSETDETFLDRLERSKKVGRNLFFEEWEAFAYLEGCDY